MNWNYRVIKTVENGDDVFAIHDVYYHSDGTPRAYSVNPSRIIWLEEDEPTAILDRMQGALLKPVLTDADFDSDFREVKEGK